MAIGGVFCIENWSGDLRSTESVRDLLEFLDRHGAARTVHQRVSTTRELGHYLSRFASQSSYRVAHLALHGGPGGVYVGSARMNLETLIRWSTLQEAPRLDPAGEPENWVVDLRGKVLYLGSCASLQISKPRLQELRRTTGAVAVCGYRRRVDWLEAAGFEVLLLSSLAAATSGQRHRVAEAIRRLWARSGTLMDTLGFVSEPDYRRRRASAYRGRAVFGRAQRS